MNWSHIIPIIRISSAVCRALLEARLRGPISEVLARKQDEAATSGASSRDQNGFGSGVGVD